MFKSPFRVLMICLSSMMLMTLSLISQNLISNPEFDNGKNGWVLKTLGSAIVSSEVSNAFLLSGMNALVVHCKAGGSVVDDIQVYHPIQQKTGRIYHFSFLAMSDIPHKIKIGIADSKQAYWESDSISLTSISNSYGPYDFDCLLTDGSYRFEFMLGGLDSVNVTLDSVVMTMTHDPDHPRPEDKFEIGLHPFQDMILPYRLFIPSGMEPSHLYPLILALHGVGECGTDNEIQLTANRLALTWSDSANQVKWPCFVIVPQCPVGLSWTEPMTFGAVVDLLDSLIHVFPVDTNRIYVTGLSMGGFGTWNLITQYPDRFAAAVPMSAGGDTTQVSRLMKVPIWDFHGAMDGTVPVSQSRDMMMAFERDGRQVVYTHCFIDSCNTNPDSVMESAIAHDATLLYTEYAGGGHTIWNESYDLPQLHQWMFAQSLNKTSAINQREFHFVPNGFSLSQNYPNPFNPSTTISYGLPVHSRVMLDIYNVLGQRVARLVDEEQEAGFKTVIWNAQVSSGMYFCRLEAVSVADLSKHFMDAKKILLLR